MALNDLVHSTVTSDGAGLRQVGFGTALLVAYHTRFPELARVYEDLAGMVTDGFETYDPAYRMVQRAFQQEPRPDRVIVGRLATPYTQTIKWVPTVTTLGYVQTLTIEVDGEVLTAEYTNAAYSAAFTADATTNLYAAAGHVLQLNDIVTVTNSGGGLPAGLVAATNYHVITVVAGVSFALSATEGGAAIDITTAGTGTHTFHKAAPSVATVIDGMKTAVQALDDFDSDLTVTGALTYLQIASAAGKITFYSDWTGTYEDVTADPGVTDDLTAIQLYNDDWYGIAIDLNAKAIQRKVSDWIETQNKIHCEQTSDWLAYDSGETTDIGDVLMGLSYARTATYFSLTNTGSYHSVGGMAERFPHDPGKKGAGGTWHGKTIAGVTADALTPTQKTNLRAKNYIVYISTAGRSHTLDGKTASGEFVDVTRGIDWVKVRMQEAVAQLDLDAEKIPLDDGGIGQVQKEVSAILDLAVNVGFFTNNPYPTVSVPKAANISTADKRARALRGVTWAAELAGAIHLSEIAGNVSV